MTKARELADLLTTAGGIDTTELADDAVTAAKLDDSASFTVNGLTVDGEARINTTSGKLTFVNDVAGWTQRMDAGDSSLYISSGVASPVKRIKAGNNGDITMYKDDGSTAGLTFDASSGSLLVGTNDSFPGDGDSNTGVVLSPTGSAAFSRDGFRVVSVNRNTSDGTLVEFNKGGSEVGVIGSNTKATDTNLYIGSSDTGLYFFDDQDVIQPVDSIGNDRDNAIDLGRSAVRFKDGYFAGDLYVGDQIIHDGDSNTYLQFDGADSFRAVTGGIERMAINSAGTIFNDGSADMDFRVESDANTHMLFVDGGLNAVGIGTGSPVDQSSLTVAGSISVTASDSGFGAGGNRAFMDLELSSDRNVRIGYTSGGTTSSANLDFYAVNGASTLTKVVRMEKDGDLNIINGNLVVASGHGIDFSATSGSGTSELFDDYEEGTFTSTITFDDATDFSPDQTTTVTAYYTKIGRICHVIWPQMGVSTVSALNIGDIIAKGSLPFTAAPTAGIATGSIYPYSVRGRYYNSTNDEASYAVFVTYNSSTANFQSAHRTYGGGWIELLGSASYIYASLTYETA